MVFEFPDWIKLIFSNPAGYKMFKVSNEDVNPVIAPETYVETLQKFMI